MRFFLFILSALILACVGCGVRRSGGGGDDNKPPSLPLASSFGRIYGVNMGLAEGLDNPDFGWQPDDAQIRSKLAEVAPFVRRVKFFSSAHGAENAARIAHEEFGLGVCATAWIGVSSVDNDQEIAGLIAAINGGHVDIGVVGSEAILRGDVTVSQLIAYMDQVRAATAGSGVPIATAEVYSIFIGNPSLIAACDVVMGNFYPFWEGVAIGQAVASLEDRYQELVTVAGGKPVYISETGWSSGGQTIGNAVPSEPNAARYFREFIAWATTWDVPYWYFESHDEPWKGTGAEGPLGAHWGFLFEAGGLKPGMEEGFSQLLLLSYVPPKDTSENLEGWVQFLNPSSHRIVVYIQVGSSWWVKPYAATPITGISSGGWFSTDITTGGSDSSATKIAVYLIPAWYSPPILLGVGSLPAELEENAVASVTVIR